MDHRIRQARNIQREFAGSAIVQNPDRVIVADAAVRQQDVKRVNVTVQPTPNLQETVPIFYAIN